MSAFIIILLVIFEFISTHLDINPLISLNYTYLFYLYGFINIFITRQFLICPPFPFLILREPLWIVAINTAAPRARGVARIS